MSLGVHRIYTEEFRVLTESTQSDLGSTQSLHRPANSGSTQNDSVSTQSLYKGIQIYTGSTQNNLGSALSLQRAIQIYTDSTQKQDQS